MNDSSLLHTFFEHDSVAYEEIGWSVNHPMVEKIDRINNQHGIEFIHLGYKKMHATQFVGLMNLGKESIQVLPKIDAFLESENNSLELRYASAASNLMVMLAYAFNITVNPLDLAEMETQRISWFEWLTFLFASELVRQLQLGVHKAYINREEVLPLIRGKWDLNRQFTRHPLLIDKFEIEYSDFNSDTLLNRVFMAAVSRLDKLTQDPVNYRLLNAARALMISADCIENPVLESDYGEKIQFSRLDNRFHTAYLLADLFLRGSVTNIFHGRQESYTFMFDMNKLFEKFAAEFLRRHKGSIFGPQSDEIKITPQASRKREYFLTRQPGGEKVFLLHPDILLWEKSRLRSIIDTKYKQLDDLKISSGINEGDSYQMLAYATTFNCPKILLLYPQADSHALRSQFQITNHSARISIATINLHQPLNRPVGLINEFRQVLDYLNKEEYYA